MCGATGRPARCISITVFQVPSVVEPPAPKVTEKKAGPTSASLARTARSFSAPSWLFGGKNSKLNVRPVTGAPPAAAGWKTPTSGH